MVTFMCFTMVRQKVLRCSNCKRVGHNARTCTSVSSQPTAPTASAVVAGAAVRQRCSNCNERGHNVCTCTAVSSQPTALPTLQAATPARVCAATGSSVVGAQHVTPTVSTEPANVGGAVVSQPAVTVITLQSATPAQVCAAVSDVSVPWGSNI